MTQPVEPEAQGAVDDYLSALDKAVAPDAVHGIYLTGSVALNDWRPGRSDLDFLVLLNRELTDAEAESLAESHAALEGDFLDGRPHCDAFYVPVSLAGRNSEIQVPHSLEGEFRRPGHVLDPVMWETLDRYGVTLRGPSADTLGAAPDREWLRDWNLRNLEEYWIHREVGMVRTVLADREPDAPVNAEIVFWLALGPGRLHYTIATGDVISKTASADYTAEHFPAFADLLAAAKAWRLGDDSVAVTAADAVLACDLIEAVHEDARHLAPHAGQPAP